MASAMPLGVWRWHPIPSQKHSLGESLGRGGAVGWGPRPRVPAVLLLLLLDHLWQALLCSEHQFSHL